MVKQLWTKKDIEDFGFIYEPNAQKCKTFKLAGGYNNEYDKSNIAKKIYVKYVHSVFINTDQPSDFPQSHYDHRVMVKGHTIIDIL